MSGEGDSLIDSIRRRDPARPTVMEVVFAYPGFHALLLHRCAHAIWNLEIGGWKPQAPARFISYLARLLTGVDIHPAAKIGKRLFIDHGTGLVIGETAVIGDDVTLYHGVTLGGRGGDTPGSKRHPTIESGASIGAYAQILGAVTIGKNAKIGAGSLVTRDIPEECTAIGNPARIVNCPCDHASYGIPDTEQNLDPVGETISGMLKDIEEMKTRLGLETKKPDAANDPEKDYASLWTRSGI